MKEIKSNNLIPIELEQGSSLAGPGFVFLAAALILGAMMALAMYIGFFG
jgi:hypothetical protein